MKKNNSRDYLIDSALKHTEEEYLNCCFFGYEEDFVINKKDSIVRCRKAHTCSNCRKEIQINEFAYNERGFMDGEPVSCYTCIPCLDAWIDEEEAEDDE